MSFFWSGVSQYRQAYTGSNPSQVQTAMDGFEDVIRRFPKCAEGYALYAQVWSRPGFLKENSFHTLLMPAWPYNSKCCVVFFSGIDWSAAVWKSRRDVWQVYRTGAGQRYHICPQGVGIYFPFFMSQFIHNSTDLCRWDMLVIVKCVFPGCYSFSGNKTLTWV